MSPVARKGVAQLGQIGYIAKGMALGLVGGLLSYATLTADRQKQGLDGAIPPDVTQSHRRRRSLPRRYDDRPRGFLFGMQANVMIQTLRSLTEEEHRTSAAARAWAREQ